MWGAWKMQFFVLLTGCPKKLFGPVWLVMQMGQLLAIPGSAGAALLWRRKRLALDLMLSGFTSYPLAKGVKAVVKRGRPGPLLVSVSLRGAHARDPGFVSGHAADAVALASAATPYFGRRGRLVIWAVPALVGGARIYVGAHLPLDVAGGAGLGYACSATVHLLLGRPPSVSGLFQRR